MPPKKRSAVDGAVARLAAAKLSESGLTLEDADRLKIQLLTPDQTLALGFQKLPAMKLNYCQPSGKPMVDWPKRPPFYRLRYLAQPAGFEALTDKKEQRYTQPPNSACCAYFPQNVDNWSLTLENPDLPLILTEGELKAACACQNGFPTVGLGGVYNWRSLLKGVELLPELKAIKWVGRNVYLCFDSDYLTNPMVLAALRDLCDMLVDEGAFVHVVTLPALGAEGKTGLDDYIMAEGSESFRTLLTEAPALGLTKPLFEFNSKYIYIQSPGLVVHQDTFDKVAPSAFKEHVESVKTYQEKTMKADGTISHKLVSAAATWLSWPLRYQARKLTYKPGGERFIESEGPAFNTWPGWAVQPKKGDVKPFLKLIDHLFQGAEPEAKDWFLKWLACPLQRPGLKQFSSAVMHGTRHGTGKSLVGYTMKAIYGKNFTEITQADLHGGFNEWAEGKQFVMGDDVTGSNKRQDADLLKKLITQSDMRVNVKYVPSYTIPDCINYFFTSNHPDAFFLEDDDRRFFIHEVAVGPLEDSFYLDYVEWLGNGGAAGIFFYLQSLKLGSYNPAAAAFKTQARARLIADTQSDLGGWVRSLLNTPDALLQVGSIKIERDLFTTQELLALYDPLGKTGTTANGLGRELKRAGAPQACQGMPVRLPDGAQARFYIIRRRERWLGAAPQACVKHWSGTPVAAAGATKERRVKF